MGTSETRDGTADLAELSDGQLVSEAADRQPRGLSALYDRHVASVYRYSLSLLGSVEDAEDATQEVFITAWRRASSIRLVDSSALPWLLVTTKYTCANRHRTIVDDRRRRDEGDLDDRADTRFSPEAEVERRQLRIALDIAVSELSAIDQQLYFLCIEEGRTYEAAAADLALTRGAVRNRLFRLRNTLRGRLNPITRQDFS